MRHWQHRIEAASTGRELRIVLVGINYEPELAGIGPYTTGLAKYLASEGHQVTVVTGVPHYPQWARALYQKGDATDNPRVSRYNHFIPRRPRAFGRSLYEVTWLLSAMRARPAKSDIVIGVVPSLSGAVLAWLIARRQRIPFGILFQDLMGSAAVQSGYTGGKRLAWLISRIELSIARRAAGVAIVAEGFRRYLEAGGVMPSKISRVRNWAVGFTPSTPPDEIRRKFNWGAGEFVCLHAGNMGQKQALDNLLEVAKLVEGTGIIIVLAGDGNDRVRLVKKARNLGLANVQFIGVQPSGAYESMLLAADVLLLNQRASVSDMALPSKLSSYFAAGRPVVASVAPDSEAAREVLAAHAGAVVPPGDPVSFARAIIAIRDKPNAAAMHGREAIEYARGELTPSGALHRHGQFLHLLTEGGGLSLSEAVQTPSTEGQVS